MDPQTHHATGEVLRNLLTVAWLLPLAGFVLEIFAGYWSHRLSKAAAYSAVFCIVTGFVCSVSALLYWGEQTHWSALESHESAGEHAGEVAHGGHAAHNSVPKYFSGTYYALATFGKLKVVIDWHIDSLTLVMFAMVTLCASMIHIFALGYMADELTEHHEDHQVHTGHGHFHRPGRYYKFFAYFSLFSFSMLGLVLAGNVFQVFVFWELVGVCSYFLIGFYFERKTASTAANKAFIMNRVGDFGFIIGLMILWTWFGTFQFNEREEADGTVTAGLFDMLRNEHGQIAVLPANDHEPHARVFLAESGSKSRGHADGHKEGKTIPYFLLVAAGLGVFGGCVGKSAQFPLQTWLPDAMEGPTPVSALVHSATMVAAGVYLAGRFYPMFLPEVLLTIAYVGCITLFLAATIAVVATDIKRVLAYSTISQLGYMMLGIGVGGWVAGLLHLITHAFFKSLMFLASGSVIHGCHHEQEMPQMGGLLKKMPITAGTMLVGVIAICGLAIPGLFGFSGYYSKDEIIATAMTYSQLNGSHFLLFIVPLVGAGITAFYMFRLWFYTFWGEPRDAHVHEHAHESPVVMWAPLVVLSVFAIGVAWFGILSGLLLDSEPAGVAHGMESVGLAGELSLPSHHQIHENHAPAGTLALLVALTGSVLSYLFYGARVLNPADVQRQFAGLHQFLVEKWQFDTLYDRAFVRPAHVVASWFAAFDRNVLDGLLHWTAKSAVDVSSLDRRFDEAIVDGLVNLIGNVTFDAGRSLRQVQTGRLRQYVMFIVLGVVGIWVVIRIFAA